jgi:hypothetical protein
MRKLKEDINPHVYVGEEFKTNIKTKVERWEDKKDYQYNEVMVDLRILDPEGTLKLETFMNSNNNRQELCVALQHGVLYLKVKREI